MKKITILSFLIIFCVSPALAGDSSKPKFIVGIGLIIALITLIAVGTRNFFSHQLPVEHLTFKGTVVPDQKAFDFVTDKINERGYKLISRIVKGKARIKGADYSGFHALAWDLHEKEVHIFINRDFGILFIYDENEMIFTPDPVQPETLESDNENSLLGKTISVPA